MTEYLSPAGVRFAELFHALRSRTGMSQEDVSREWRVSKASISRFLAGKQVPRPTTLESFERFVRTRLGEDPDLVEARPEDLQRAQMDLQRLRDLAPTEYGVLRGVIGKTLREVELQRKKAPATRAPGPKDAISQADADALTMLERASEAVSEGERSHPSGRRDAGAGGQKPPSDRRRGGSAPTTSGKHCGEGSK